MSGEAPRARVLFVDDEPRILRALERLFQREPLLVQTAGGADEALERLATEPPHVIVSDHQMPGRDGVSLLREVRERAPDVVRVLLTGCRDMDVAADAINRAGVDQLLTKPWNEPELKTAVRRCVETFHMRREIERLNRLTQEQNRDLERRVRERTAELKEKHAEVRRAYVQTVQALAEAVDAKDAYTRGHSERVGVYASRIARELGCEDAFIERIYLAGLLHDIGKIGIPDAVLCKPGRLADEEREVMRQHPEIGARILEPVGFLADIVPCVRHHHEWYDGSDRGYPDRLRGTRIPFPSRIILVADTVEAMTSDRPYRNALELPIVVDELRRQSGVQFDPQVVDACLALLEREEDGFLERASKFDLERFLRETPDHP